MHDDIASDITIKAMEVLIEYGCTNVKALPNGTITFEKDGVKFKSRAIKISLIEDRVLYDETDA